MPTISQFHGIDIVMYFNDHVPPHFHVFYGDDEALIEWRPLQIHRGSLPAKSLRLVLRWAGLHLAELDADWALARQGRPLYPIPPLP